MGNRSSDRRISLGLLGKPFGLKGHLYLRYYGNNHKGLVDFKQIFISGQKSSFSIEKSIIHKGKTIVKFEGVDDRNASEKYKGKEIFVLEKHLPPLHQDEYYWYQLKDLKVINEEQEILGTIDHVMETGADDVLVVKPSRLSIDQEQRLIPFSTKEVVKKVDLGKMLLYVKWPKHY